jgi:hypothetical protein
MLMWPADASAAGHRRHSVVHKHGDVEVFFRKGLRDIRQVLASVSAARLIHDSVATSIEYLVRVCLYCLPVAGLL